MIALYYIASIKHTGREHEHITWWGLDRRGYTPVVGERCGTYTLSEVLHYGLNDGESCIAVPVDAAAALLSPEPYYRPCSPARFYDQRGPVVENSRKAWNALIKASLAEGRTHRPKPEVFRGKRRAFALPLEAAS